MSDVGRQCDCRGANENGRYILAKANGATSDRRFSDGDAGGDQYSSGRNHPRRALLNRIFGYVVAGRLYFSNMTLRDILSRNPWNGPVKEFGTFAARSSPTVQSSDVANANYGPACSFPV